MSNFTLFPYFGGKFYMIKKLIPLFPIHTAYIEPFCGSAVVLLNKPKSQYEVINDISDDIVNLFIVVKNKPNEFYDCFKYVVGSRMYFNKLLHTNPTTLNDVQRAFRFFYIQKYVVNSIPKNTSFKTNRNNKIGINFDTIKDTIDKVYDRIKNVIIEHTSFEEVFRNYDKHCNFFYLDPPYFEEKNKLGIKHEYVHAFSLKDFKRLRKCCENMKGKFLMSINKTEYTRKLFSDFYIKEIQHIWGTKGRPNSNNAVTELLISNYITADNYYAYDKGFFRQEVS